MRRRGGGRWVLALAAMLVLVMTGGIGYAAFTSTATINGTATSGTVDLVVTAMYLGVDPPGAYVQSNVLPATHVTAWVNNTAPSTDYNITIVVENIGTVPATGFNYIKTETTTGPSACHFFGSTFSDSALNRPPGDALAPGVPFATYWDLHAPAFSDSCGGEPYLTFSVTFTATAGD